jgi:membrane fusion protein (multidrug efflux system)
MSVTTPRPQADRAIGRLKPLLIFMLVLGLLAGLWAASRAYRGKPAETDDKAYTGPFELAAADVAVVEQRSLTRSLPLSGSLTPLVQATVKARVAGDVLEMRVREGQAVQQGEVLARIDVRTLAAQADSQRAALDKARADLALATTNRDTSAVMLRERFISRNAFDAAQSAFDAAAANVRLAEAQARLAQIGVDDALVRAPIAGIVSQRLVQPGEKVSPDVPLLAIVDLSRLELEAPAPASEIPSVKIGQTASFTVGGYGERRFTATVERINPVTDAGTRSIRLYLSVDNADGALRGGLFVQGTLLLDHSAPAPTLPTAAIRSDSGVDYVLVIDGDRLQRRAVKLGLRADDEAHVEVREGVTVGTRVLASRIDKLNDGTQVVFAKTAAPASPAAAP